MSPVRVSVCALALALLFLVPVLPSGGPSSRPQVAPEASGPTEIVRILTSDGAAADFGPDVEVLESYPGFVLARVPAAMVQRIESRGLTVVREDTFSLHVNGYAFDTREALRVPAALEALPVLEGRGYFLVQFHGPVKEEWKAAVEAQGAQIIAYVPNNAFLVRASPSALVAAQTVREVQWTGAYHPAFRISPDLLTSEGIVKVRVFTFSDESVHSVVATLAKLGLRVVGRWSPDVGILSWAQYEDFGVVQARLDAISLIPLARLNGVRYIEPWEEMRLATRQEQFVLQTNASAEGAGARRIWDLGIRGDGQTIALSDTGVDFDHTMFRQSQGSPAQTGDIYNVTVPTRRKLVRYLPMSGFVGVDPFNGGDPETIKDSPGSQPCFGPGGTGHGTSTASAAAGDDSTFTPQSLNDGMAPNAKIVAIDIGGLDTMGCDSLRYLPDDYNDLFGGAYASQARIFSNSWGGASSSYTFDASMADRFIWNNPDALILFANGNNPPNALVGSPATAKNVVSVSGANGWDTSQREAMGAASRGPTADGRRKPDITTVYWTTTPGGTADSDGLLTSFNSAQTGFGGTSYATPLAAGMAALTRNYFLSGWYPRGLSGGLGIAPSAALLKAVLAASSVQMVGAGACPPGDAFYPNIAQGWGRVWLDEGLYFAGPPADTKKLFIVDHRNGVRTGDALEYRVSLASAAGGLRVMLAWSDAPGLEGASPALVNNLDLEVTDPSGTVYRGNVRGSCPAGQTLTGGSFDVLNNLEGVVRRSPAVGEWKIRVIAANVPTGPQRFGLVVLADLNRNYGIVELDKTVYSESDNIQVTVTDADAASVSVTLTSNTEPGGETISLTQPNNGQIWRGIIATDYGVPAADGQLQVSHGDTITATYNDLNPAHAATATARVEVDPVAISDVRATSITNAAATIRWTTDKPSNSTVFYGTTGPTLAASDNALTTSHSVTLTGLATDTAYLYDVASTRVGHTTRDTNDGRHYSFRTSERAEILLVVSDSSFPPERLEMYRSALAGSSWSWNEWDISRQGNPPLATLQEFKAVLWQAGLEQYPPMADAHASLLKTYVDLGGRIMFSGHDYSWAACDGASPYTTGARCTFVRSIMKGDYVADPATFSQEVGTGGDPISGAYTSGVSYVPHRSGGAADEVTSLAAGGTTATVWNTNSGAASNDDGLRWESSANNGTGTAGCVWCGSRSRVVSYFFEFTGINFAAGVPNNAARTDILNKTIVWLLGRSPPIVRVTSPNGGETIASNTLPVFWSRSQPLATQEMWYSRDSGASWAKVKNLGAADQLDNVDISNVAQWPNGDRYLIRIVVNDTGSPRFKAQDASDATFTISRSGGDLEGPLVRPGSLRISPNPAKNGLVVRFNATIDDALRGGSNIQAAEYFVQATAPTPAEYGTGTAMTAADGAFSAPVEAVTATTTATWPAGNTECVWTHGRDAATPTANWGPVSGVCFLVTPSSAGVPPNPPTNVNAILSGGTFQDVQITWSAPVGGGTVDHYQVYFSTVYDAAKASYALLQDNIPFDQLTFSHAGNGSGNPNSYFYYVRAVNAGGSASSADQAAKFTRQLTTAGWNLVSIPVTPADNQITAALQTLTWRTARTYVAGAADGWRAWYNTRSSGDLRTVSAGMALWVDIVSPDDFTIAGRVPSSTTINLKLGWNFVGYASFITGASQNAATSFAGRGVNHLEGFSPAAQYYLQRLTIATTNLEPGRGYWVHATVGGDWTVTNS